MIHPDETVFFTNDLALKQIANMFFGSDSVKSVRTEPEEDYDGYHRIQMTEDEMAEFYSKPTENIYNLNINEYLIISDTNDDIIDTLYIAKDDDKYPKQSTAKEYYDELQDYGWLGTVLNWLQKVNVIVEDYLTWCDEQNKEAKTSF